MNSILSLAGGIVAQALDPAGTVANMLDGGKGLLGADGGPGSCGGSGSFLGGHPAIAGAMLGLPGTISGSLA